MASVSSFREAFLYWNVLYNLGLSFIACPPSLHRFSWKSVDEFSSSNSRFKGDCSVSWHGGERTYSSVCWSWTLETVWCFITVLVLLSNKILLPFAFLWLLFFLSLSVRKQKFHSSAWQLFCSHCPWHSVFPILLWLFSKVIRIRPESKSDWMHPPTGGEKAQYLKWRDFTVS